MDRYPSFAQKFILGEVVMVRPFDEIDRSELGDILMNDRWCFSIRRDFIDAHADRGFGYFISTIKQDRGTYVYLLSEVGTNIPDGFWWAQGMLYGREEEEFEPPDTDGLLGFLFG